ncbi:hypothetical protein TrRE_jg13376 [Triparma retinervis]|uniref:Uncharacterized protein n=1 Tax=Triparma retinervis TaxID=2557542 RepID=A0A9W6Z9F2_9STRA|nr:hypothetical protein TrRE_jg13376 [Triparma retinervis]
MFRSVGGGDSGELVATACTQSTSHPPGYPLLLLLNGIVLKFGGGLGTPAMVLNGFNALLGSLANTSVLLCGVLLSQTVEMFKVDEGGGGDVEEIVKEVEAVGGSVGGGRGSGGGRGGRKKKKGGGKKTDGGGPKTPTPSTHPTTPPPSKHLRPLPPAKFYACMAFASMFGFSRGIWEYCTQLEVFPLNNLLCGLLLMTTAKFIAVETNNKELNEEQRGLAVLGGLLCGLCMCNQHTSSIFIIICVLAVATSMELALLKRDKVTLALTATATLVGLSPYLYLVVRSNSKAIDGWGDQSTLSGFLTHFLRREYGTFALASEWESGEEQDGDKVVRRLILNAKQFNEDTLYLGGIAAARFAWGAGIRGNRAGVVAVVCWLGYSFPGTRHHPYDPEGFDMKTFLDVNVGREDAELYVAGDWKQGDNTQDVYQRVPVGLADKVVAPGEEVELYEFAKALSKNLDKVGRFDKETTIDVVEGSWELVMRIKYQNYFLRASHYIASNVVGFRGPGAQKVGICKVAIRAYEYLLDVSEDDGVLMISRSSWRNAGVVAAVLGRELDGGGEEEELKKAAEAMFKFWGELWGACVREGETGAKDCKEISLFLDHGVNPYSQRKWRGEEGFEFLDEWVGIHEGNIEASRGRGVNPDRVGQ